MAGTDTTGRGATDFAMGPLGADFKAALNLTVGNTTWLRMALKPMPQIEHSRY